MLESVWAARRAGCVRWREQGVYYQRIEGGGNNALYRIRQGATLLACKLYVVDERRRAEREYQALKLLQAAGADLAPAPWFYFEATTERPLPALFYSWTVGTSICGEPDQASLEALLVSLQAIHSLRPATAPAAALAPAIFHWPDLEAYAVEIEELLKRYGGWLQSVRPGGEQLRRRMEDLVGRGLSFLRTVDFQPAQATAAASLVHVDVNLSNILWGPDGRVRWVDWEYAGWGDPALDLAEFAWHAGLEHWSAAAQSWLRANYIPAPGDDSFARRLAILDVVLGVRWPLIVLRNWWSLHNGPDRERLTLRNEPEAVTRARFERYLKRGEDLEAFRRSIH